MDGYRYHRSRHAWQKDRRRKRDAYACGDDFRRYTYGDVFERPSPMLRELFELLPGRVVLDRPRYSMQMQDGHPFAAIFLPGPSGGY